MPGVPVCATRCDPGQAPQDPHRRRRDHRRGPRRTPAAAPQKRRPANSSRIPPLSELSAAKGLPQSPKPSKGETRMLRAQRLIRMVDALTKEEWKPRAKKRNTVNIADTSA